MSERDPYAWRDPAEEADLLDTLLAELAARGRAKLRENEPADDKSGAPVAWLISERRGNGPRIVAGKVFLSEETANAAAARLTNRWRTCSAFPVRGAP